MQNIAQYIPLIALLLCDTLYILETKIIKYKWLFNVAVISLHIFAIIYFLFTESSMEIMLLFLMASFAAALTVNTPKTQKNKIQENNL